MNESSRVFRFCRRRVFTRRAMLAVAFGVILVAAPALAAVPANDAFSDARTLSGASGSISGDTTGATHEEGEPARGMSGSVWFEWTPTTSGAVSFGTVDTPMGTGYIRDTILTVWTGSSFSELTRVTWNDDVDPDNFLTGGMRSRVSFEAVAGTTYRISLETWYEIVDPPTVELPPTSEPATPSDPSQGLYVLTWESVERDPAADIADTIDFFQTSMSTGGITGVGGPTAAAGKLAAFGDMLTAAEAFIAQGDYQSAIGQLNAVYAKCDGAPHPPDFVDGSAKQELANQILTLIVKLQARL